MSEFFTAVHDPQIVLFQMANRRAAIFVALTNVAAQLYSVTDVVISKQEDEFRVHAEPFCDLVERVFEQPINLLYVWATYAAGFYEALKGEQCIWIWGGGVPGVKLQGQAMPIEAQHYGDAPKAILTNKIIGPHWYRAD